VPARAKANIMAERSGCGRDAEPYSEARAPSAAHWEQFWQKIHQYGVADYLYILNRPHHPVIDIHSKASLNLHAEV
jgi:hypothetical protein